MGQEYRQQPVRGRASSWSRSGRGNEESSSGWVGAAGDAGLEDDTPSTLRDEQWRALDGYAQALAAPGQPAAALSLREQAVRLDPLRERSVRALMELLISLGQFDAAVNAYVSLARRLQEELGLSPLPATQVLRERGAARVLAVDVGHGQLDPVIAADPGVTAVEGFNVRYMTAQSLAEAAADGIRPEIVTGDLSFISLTLVLPAIAAATVLVLLVGFYPFQLRGHAAFRRDAVEHGALAAIDRHRAVLAGVIDADHRLHAFIARAGAGKRGASAPRHARLLVAMRLRPARTTDISAL